MNVSRSYLQSDGNVKKISSHITKKVADKLAEMFKNDRADFESKWDDLQVFVQYGTLTDEKFAEKAKSFSLVKTTDGKYYTVDEYKEKIAPLQTDKDNKTVVLYTNNADLHFGFIKKANDRGYSVLQMDSPLTPHWISKMEQTFENVTFSRVDADSLDKLIKKDEELPSKLSKEDEDKLKPVFENAFIEKEKFSVQFESLSSSESPIIVTQPEFIRRMMEQQRMGGGGFYGAFPEKYNIIINSNSDKISDVLNASEEDKTKKAKQLVDLALLSQGMLTGEALSSFIERSIELV